MQLVVSGNRILAHGEDCFLCMGGTVICMNTGRKFENATVVECDNCPSDINERGYEYHAGTFVPCAPYGKGDGNLAVVCGEDCKAVKDSGFPLAALISNGVPAAARVVMGTYIGTGLDDLYAKPNTLTFDGKPLMVLLYNPDEWGDDFKTAHDGHTFLLIREVPSVKRNYSDTQYTVHVSWGENSVTLTQTSRSSVADYPNWNRGGVTYGYIAILGY